MLGLIIALMVLPFAAIAVLSQDDPCKNYKMLFDDGGRSSNCPLYHPDSHDRFITEGWRRVQLKSTGEDLTMPTECVPHGYCGSHSNVWLNGTHPTVEDGIVDRMGCLSMFSSCCEVQYPIQIKNCTDYMVYNLMRTLGSDERYCFGESNPCYLTTITVRPTTTTTHSTTKTSSSTTTMSRSTTTTSRPTTTSSRPTTTSSRLTTTTRPTTKASRLTSKTSRPTTNDYRSSDFGFRTDEVVTILAVCLSITMTILIALVLGIFFYCRQRRMLNKLPEASSATTRPAYENPTDNIYDTMSLSQHKVQLYETLNIVK